MGGNLSSPGHLIFAMIASLCRRPKASVTHNEDLPGRAEDFLCPKAAQPKKSEALSWFLETAEEGQKRPLGQWANGPCNCAGRAEAPLRRVTRTGSRMEKDFHFRGSSAVAQSAKGLSSSAAECGTFVGETAPKKDPATLTTGDGAARAPRRGETWKRWRERLWEAL